jgi:hypothetical protein
VLLDYVWAKKNQVHANIRRVDPAGEIVWAAETRSSSDVFTDVDWSGDRLVAHTWEGRVITLDADIGVEVESAFTK